MRETFNTITDELLARYLLGEAAAAEAAQVQEWLSLHSDNQRYFDHFKYIWEQSQLLAARSIVNEEEAWERLQQRMLAATETKVIRLRQRRIWAAAAAVLLGVIIGTWWWTYNGSGHRKELALRADDSVRTDTLPDGSVVTLNKKTILRFNNRKVQLEGEAFFDIRKDVNRPFLVEANGNEIKVLGTSFNVKARDTATEIVVATGSVAVTSHGNMVYLNAGERTVIKAGQDKLLKENNTDVLYNYYLNRDIVCTATPLWILAEKLEEVYNVHIIIDNEALRGTRLTTTLLTDMSLNEMLNMIKMTLPEVRIEQHGDEIRIK